MKAVNKILGAALIISSLVSVIPITVKIIMTGAQNGFNFGFLLLPLVIPLSLFSMVASLQFKSAFWRKLKIGDVITIFYSKRTRIFHLFLFFTVFTLMHRKLEFWRNLKTRTLHWDHKHLLWVL